MGREQRRGQRKESRGQAQVQICPPSVPWQAWGIADKVKGNCKIRTGNLYREARCKAVGPRLAERVEESWGKRTWQPDFLWQHPRLISLQCSVCA